MSWRVFAAAAIGKSHIDAGTPCQDAFFSELAGETLVAAVCDGAGSQPLSHIGSSALSRLVVQSLARRLCTGESLLDLDAGCFADAVADAVTAARGALEAEAQAAGIGLDSYAATLVGVVGDGDRGYFFHIGDGQGVAEAVDASQTPVLSLPENGEYANETYFATGAAWREHLRVTPITWPAQRLLLMSDGAASFVLGRGGNALYRPFLEPVERFLLSTADENTGNAALASTLDDPRTHRITGDDKALLIALRR